MSTTSLGPRPQAGVLCNACTDLFTHFSPIFGLFDNKNPFAPTQTPILGPLGRIWASTCPFCRLVTQATLEIHRTENSTVIPGPDQVIGVQWHESGALPGFRLCFVGYGTVLGTAISFTQAPWTCRSSLSPNHSLSYLCDIRRSHIDIGRVRSWLNRCYTEHPKCLEIFHELGAPVSSVFPGLRVLRLIDVQAQCIIETDRFCQYMTLSYVWGGIAGYRLTRASRAQLTQPGILRAKWLRLPRTIKDAITLVFELGQRYLWVDSLCLIQNQPEDVQAGTAVMDLIYELSTLTIIAATGHDSNAGLPGVRIGSRNLHETCQSVKVLPGVEMRVHTSLQSRVEASVYNTRGWT